MIQRLFNPADVLAEPGLCTGMYGGMRRGDEKKVHFRGLLFFTRPSVRWELFRINIVQFWAQVMAHKPFMSVLEKRFSLNSSVR